MFDTTIVISTPGTQLATDSSHYTLRSNGRRIGRIPPAMISQMIIHHGVDVSGKALARLSDTGVPTTFLGPDGRVRARLCPPWKHDAIPRIHQAEIYLDVSSRLSIARRIVDAKAANCATVLKRHAGNYPDPSLLDAAKRIRSMRANVAIAQDLDVLMGHEGNIARIYFSVFGKMLRTPWASFSLRTRRPPLDPVNALLSYSYAILCHQLLARLEGVGLDPYIGFLHATQPRRPSLSLDLMEPFRPVLADRLCLRLMNLGVVREEHFESRQPQPGIFLNAAGRREVLESVVPWGDSCDADLDANGSQPSSPLGLLTREVDHFAVCAREGRLRDFRPYYLSASDSETCPGPVS